MLDFDLNNKQDRILAAALGCFKQYGFKRTSMDDIAKSSQVSRPALYLLFKNKTDIFRAIAKRFHEFTLVRAQGALKEEGPLSVRIENAIIARKRPLMALAFGSLHGPELFDTTLDIASDINQDAQNTFSQMIENVIAKGEQDGVLDLKTSKLTVAELTALLNASAAGLKHHTHELEAYETLLRKSISVLLAGLTV